MEFSVQQNNVNFKSTPLRQIKIPKTSGSFVNAVFSKLDINKDKKSIIKIKKCWNEPITSFLCQNFIDKTPNNFYAIELVNKKPLSQKIIGLAELSSYELEYIAVNPKYSYQNKATRKLKKIGEILFGEIIKEIQKINAPFLKIYSVNNAFYSKILSKADLPLEKINKSGSQNFTIDKIFFDKYLNYFSNQNII